MHKITYQPFLQVYPCLLSIYKGLGLVFALDIGHLMNGEESLCLLRENRDEVTRGKSSSVTKDGLRDEAEGVRIWGG